MSPARPPSPAWHLAYALAALVLAGALGLAWWQEGRRPWQEEVRAINQRRAELLARRLTRAGLDPARVRARVRPLAQEPPRVVEVVPAATGRPERCLTCHRGIERISPSHPVEAVGCVSCHGGQGLGLTKAAAHRGLLGRNPGALSRARAGCGGQGSLAGRCHAGRDGRPARMIYRVERTIMASMTGVLTSLRVAWGAQADFTASYGAATVSDPRRPVPPPPFTLPGLLRVPGGPPAGSDFPHLANQHWRKFCARCHLHARRRQGPSAHGRGCVACHGLRNQAGTYQGGDASLPRREPGHAALHQLVPTPGEEACRRCHNRSGRIGLNFRGWMEDENGRTPWPRAHPQYRLSGGRGIRRLLPDVHAEKGMSCIDCHTPREIMGDGRIYGRMRHQTEIRCSTCHGAYGRPVKLVPPGAWSRYEAGYGSLKKAPPLTEQTRLGLGAKGVPLANLRKEEKGLVLYLRSRPGKKLPVPGIQQDANHSIPGHRRLACTACHSRWTPQCYGCHDYRRQEGSLWDYAAGKPTPGRWQETRDLYRFRRPILGLDSRGRIAPWVPGCQVALSLLPGPDRPRILGRGPAGNGIVSTPIAPHTTRRLVRPCADCHQSPRTLGLGGGPRRLGRLAARPLSDLSALGWPADWDALVDQEGRPLAGTTHQGARPLNKEELARVLRWGRCLPCHFKPRDPVVQDPTRAYGRVGPGGDMELRHRRLEEKGRP